MSVACFVFDDVVEEVVGGAVFVAVVIVVVDLVGLSSRLGLSLFL